jgi:hypothetical protein
MTDILFYAYSTFCWSIHPWVDMWVAYFFWLLWVMLLWTWVYNNLFSLAFTFLYVHPEVGLPDHTVTCLVFQFFHILDNTCYFLLFLFTIITILMIMNYYLIVVLTHVSLMANNAEQLFIHLYIFSGEMPIQSFAHF